MNRKERKETAEDTLRIIDQGSYLNSQGEKIDISKMIGAAVKNSKLYTPEELNQLKENLKENFNTSDEKIETEIEVNNETSLVAAERLKREAGFKKVAVLNFASGTNPGGGFLNGSGAQEESLARSSGLYPCIKSKKEMYQANRNYNSALYKDYMIYSPEVPVFKKDEGSLLDRPYQVSFITAPAVNAGAVKANESRNNIKKIEPIMKERIAKILVLAAAEENEALVLGAFGCGVFQNDPQFVAEYFRKYLFDNSYFKNYFKIVVFAVLDRSKSKKTFKTFKEKLLRD